MSVLPSVQPFHAIAYPIDPMLALEIRYRCTTFCSLVSLENIVLFSIVVLHHVLLIKIYSLLFLNINHFLGSRKYAAHCSLIASRFGLASFVHPPPVPVKAEGKHCRLRVGYVQKNKSCAH